LVSRTIENQQKDDQRDIHPNQQFRGPHGKEGEGEPEAQENGLQRFGTDRVKPSE